MDVIWLGLRLLLLLGLAKNDRIAVPHEFRARPALSVESAP